MSTCTLGEQRFRRNVFPVLLFLIRGPEADFLRILITMPLYTKKIRLRFVVCEQKLKTEMFVKAVKGLKAGAPDCLAELRKAKTNTKNVI